MPYDVIRERDPWFCFRKTELMGISSKLANFALRLFLCRPGQPVAIDVPRSGPASILVMLVPGTFLLPSDYSVLRKALCGAGCVVITCNPAWNRLDVADFMTSASQLVEEAMEEGLAVIERHRAAGKWPRELTAKQGFGPLSRYARLIVCLHSLSGVVGSRSIPLRKAAGTVVLASGFSRAVGISGAFREYPLPLLSVFGEFDGQHHLAKVAIDLCNSGLIFEEPSIAHLRSFAMVDRCNHASFSNQKRNSGRGDLSLDGLDGVDQVLSMNRVASLVRTFAEAYDLVDAEASLAAEAASRLRAETDRSSRLLIPFLVALGRVPESYLRSPLPESAEDALLWKYASGKEMLPGDAPGNSFAPRHPGELAMAERFARQTQEYIFLAALGTLRPPVTVTATVHTVFETFLRSKVVECVDSETGKMMVNVQIFPFASSGEEYTHVSPMYAMKLRQGLPRAEQGKKQKAVDESGSPTAADIFNDLAWKRGEELCPPELLRRFHNRSRGKPVVKEHFFCVPPLWAKSRIKMAGNVLTLNAFDSSKTCGLSLGQSSKPEEGKRWTYRIASVLYVQVPSPAWVLEHIMVHALKDCMHPESHLGASNLN